MSSSSALSSSSSVRRASEDAKFRAFLSTHFDAQADVTGIIQQGDSEERFRDISRCVEEVDEEIKNYISLHKHDLMAGMQDVAVLSKRTMELERIHHTSVLLRQLRQFTHAKAQLDHYSATTTSLGVDTASELDLRQFATIAKTVQELEHLMEVPNLIKIEIVSKQVSQIKSFGGQLRGLARDKLLTALRDQDQATVADCLQVFFNLRSLPQAVLMAIDSTIKDTVELSSAALNFDLITEGGNTAANDKSKSSNRKGKVNSATRADMLLSNASQLRVAMREMCHHWAGVVQDQAIKVHVLQRVIAKKEDPTTHQKFSNVLLDININAATTGSHDAASSAFVKAQISQGSKSGKVVSLLDVFWNRLASSLQDVLVAKLKAHPLAAPRIYPNLHRASLEIFHALRVMVHSDARNEELFYSHDPSNPLYNPYDDDDDDVSDGHSLGRTWAKEGRAPVSLFGGMNIVPTHTFLSSGRSGSFLSTPATFGTARAKRSLTRNPSHVEDRPSGNATQRNEVQEPNKPHSDSDSKGSSVEFGLLPSLSPLRDRFLLAVLTRMNAPVLQMFPEVDGYTAAVPSKRDLQALLKCIQDEMAHVILEGDRSLLRVVAKEALKSIQLLLTKVEGMVSTGGDSTRIHLNKDNQYVKTSQQEHNFQLLQLISQLTGYIELLPAQIIKATKDSPSTALSRSVGDKRSEDNGESLLRDEMQFFVKESIQGAFELAGKHLFSPLVEALVVHFRHILLGLLKDGVTNGGGVSKTLQTVVDRFPSAVDAYFVQATGATKGNMSSMPLPAFCALQELCSRLLLTYTSIAALRRPVNEDTRLQTASEISALDMMIMGFIPTGEDKHNPALAELRNFRRLLFDPIEKDADSDTNQSKEIVSPPEASKVLMLSYVYSLRPSTILGYLLACGPKQLPSISDSHAKENDQPTKHKANDTVDSIAAYVAMLTSPANEDVAVSDDSSSSFELTARQFLGSSIHCMFLHAKNSNWKNIPSSESKSIEKCQNSLDVFKQRIAVGDKTKKANFLEWYNSLMEISNAFVV